MFTTTELSRANAGPMALLGERVLHYSPEPRIVQAVIDSARLLGRDDLVTLHQERMHQAFPIAASSAQ